MRKNRLLIAIAMLVIGGCSHTHQMTAQFSEQDFAAYKLQGTSSITGQAFLKTMGGDVKYGAGESVTLMPVTPYTAEFWQARMQHEKIADLDNRLQSFIKETIADGSGNFEFTNLPSGEYFLESDIYWKVPGPYGLETTGAAVTKRVKVSNGEKLKVILTE